MPKDVKPPPLRRRVSSEIGKHGRITEDIVQVTCGGLIARMHLKLFVCPGIRQPCIDVHGNGNFITPREFTMLADKDKQKDWKASIRIANKSLRTLIDSKALDFYEHATRCSGKCQSRNYISVKVTGEEQSSSTTATSITNVLPTTWTSQSPVGYHHFPVMSQGMSGFPQRHGFYVQPIVLPPSQSPQSLPLPVRRLSTGIPSCTVTPQLTSTSTSGAYGQPAAGSQLQRMLHGPSAEEQLVNLLHTEPVVFWTEMQRFGLLDDVLSGVEQHLANVRSSTANTNTISTENATFLTRLVTSLRLQSSVVAKIQAQQFHTMSLAASQPSNSHANPMRMNDRGDFSMMNHQPVRERNMEMPRGGRSQSNEDIDVVNLDRGDAARPPSILRFLSCGDSNMDTTPRGMSQSSNTTQPAICGELNGDFSLETPQKMPRHEQPDGMAHQPELDFEAQMGINSQPMQSQTPAEHSMSFTMTHL